ncbi:MAG: site-specific integrase [Planctomycetaceae bacterium]|nr:site-specific integrase [Planctomycetaceae bacterium]
MPKLINRNPKLSKLGKYAVVYYRGKIHYLGRHGTPEALTAYNRLCAEIQANPVFPPPSGEKRITVRELTAAFLDHASANLDPTSYSFYRVIILDFLDNLYGDETPVEEFTPRCLKLVRDEFVRSCRFCRNIVNRCTKCVIAIFAWGVENELVQETTWRALKTVKTLAKGHPGTFDHKEREAVPDEVILRTLPFMPPTLRAMVQLQRILGMRPNEIFKMRVGDIDRTRGNGLWYYVPGSYKTSAFVGKIQFPLGKPEQELITPYLEGKQADNAVFSPRTAMAERKIEKRAHRKTKISPSQAARDETRAAKPSRYSEFYNRDSYRNAIEHAITKGNKVLPESDKIPHWTPHQLRHTAATVTELSHSDEDVQALLGHRTVNMSKRYTHTQLVRREELARNRQNPFDTKGVES